MEFLCANQANWASNGEIGRTAEGERSHRGPVHLPE